MNLWPRQYPATLNPFYGNPDGADGAADPAWETAHLVAIAPPYPMVLAWAPSVPVHSIRCHRLVAASLGRVLGAIAHRYAPPDIERYGLHLFGGAYNFRLMRGGAALSMHSWGCAIDLDPGNNQFGSTTHRMPAEVVAMFAAEQWTWGGTFSKQDPMHFQAAGL